MQKSKVFTNMINKASKKRARFVYTD